MPNQFQGFPVPKAKIAEMITDSSNLIVERDPPGGPDFTEADLTCDGAAHDLDLSGIIPEGATWAWMAATAIDDAVGSLVGLQAKGATGASQAMAVITQVIGNQIAGEAWIKLDDNRYIEYLCSAVVFTSITITVRGWVN